MILSLLLSAATLPGGHFQLDSSGPSFCFDALPDGRFRLTFRLEGERNPVLIEGPYVITANKMADFHVRLTIDAIHGKTLSKCRKAWVDEPIKVTTRLEKEMRVGTELKVTLHYQCVEKRNSVQFCLHETGKDNKEVLCHTLKDFDSSCTEGPAINGAQINAPAH